MFVFLHFENREMAEVISCERMQILKKFIRGRFDKKEDEYSK